MGPMRSESMMDSPFNGEERATVALKTGTILVLHRGTLHRTVGTKDAAVARLWSQHSLAAIAFVKKTAGVGRHLFALGEAANRAHQHRF
jgi:hypothetical protein